MQEHVKKTLCISGVTHAVSMCFHTILSDGVCNSIQLEKPPTARRALGGVITEELSRVHTDGDSCRACGVRARVREILYFH